jgi:Flp pilus assembly secretin CpaC
MKYVIVGILSLLLLFAGELHAQPNTKLTVNKAVVIRLPKKATKVAVSQSKTAAVEVLAPDTVLIHGRAVGATSLVIWFEEPINRKE